MKIVDLTHDLNNQIPSWDNSFGFDVSTSIDYDDCVPPDTYKIQTIKFAGSMGTHMDSPAHFVKGGRPIDQLRLDELVVDCVVIDVNKEANEAYVIMPQVMEKFEEKYGKIKPNSFVIFYTGWDKFWNDRIKYNNDHKFPSVHESTAKLLLERNITGIGTDTFSVDTGVKGFPVHRIILGADKYLVENIANVKDLPVTGAKVFILPIKLKDGTEAPIRMIATF